jgi:hypothetical protein
LELVELALLGCVAAGTVATFTGRPLGIVPTLIVWSFRLICSRVLS